MTEKNSIGDTGGDSPDTATNATGVRRDFLAGLAGTGAALTAGCLGGGDGGGTPADDSDTGGTPADHFAAVRSQYQEMVTGYDPDTSNQYIDAYVTELNDRAETLQSNLVRGKSDRVFQDADLDGSNPGMARGHTYGRLRAMSLAYAVPGGRLSGDSDLLEDVIYGLDYMYDNDWYSEDADTPGNGWWYAVGMPMGLARISALLYDELTPTQRSNYTTAIRTHNSLESSASSPQDGDVALNSRTNVLVAAVDEDAALMAEAASFPSGMTEYQSDPPGNGFYRDGTFLNHGNHPYNWGYGRMIVGGVPPLLEMLRGTRWDQSDSRWAKNLYALAIDGYIGPMYEARQTAAFLGRSLSRPGATTYRASTGILYALARITQFAPDDVARRLREHIKYHMQAPDSVDPRTSGGGSYLTNIELMNDILDDESIAATHEPYAPTVFYAGDRAVIKSEDFAAEISAYSSRIANSESFNNEHLKGWHTGRGMTLLHTSDEQQFGGNMWPTIDWHRLPGTTVVNKPLRDGASSDMRSSRDWVGGSNLQRAGAFGMSMGPRYADISGRKSWLTLGGDRIVCLGAGITASDEEGPTETTVLNRKLNYAGNNSFVVDGTPQSTDPGWSDALSDPAWAWLEDTGGYYFPEGGTFEAKREERSGQWQDINELINRGGETFRNTFLTVWTDHGTAPSDASYAYVLLPGRDQGDVEAYASDPPLSVVKNTATVQAVHNGTEYAGNFWTGGSAGVVSVDSPASVVLESERKVGSDPPDASNTLGVGVADPTQRQGSIRVEIDRDVAPAGRNSDRVSVVETGPPLVLYVDVAETDGDTVTATFDRDS